MSGIYIPGMEMPKHGSYLFTVRYDADGNLCVYPLIYMTGYDDRDLKPETPLFPIIPIPDHGRLIDADLLCKVLQRNSEDEWNKNVAPFSWSYAYDCVKDTVENMPTIIPASGGTENE